MLPLEGVRGVSTIDTLLGSNARRAPRGEEPSPSPLARSGTPRQVPPPPQLPVHLPARRFHCLQQWERFLAAAVVSDKLDTYLCWDELEQNNNKKVQLLSSYTLFPNLP